MFQKHVKIVVEIYYLLIYLLYITYLYNINYYQRKLAFSGGFS
jgi:hypothetical protein